MTILDLFFFLLLIFTRSYFITMMKQKKVEAILINWSTKQPCLTHTYLKIFNDVILFTEE